MARLPRVTSKLFAENATEVGQFGSLNTGTKVTTTDIATIQGLQAWGDGWQAATLGDNCYPTLQERNGLDKVQSYMTNYLYQEGIPEWDSGTTYYQGSIVKLINGTDVQLYHSLVDNNTATLSDTNSWKEFSFGGVRNIGEIVTSTIPLTDAGLHLLDGTRLSGDGIYGEFVQYIADLYAENPSANYFTTEALWQTAVTTYGVCGKFVYDSVNNTVRLPKYNSKIYTGGGTAPVVGNNSAIRFVGLNSGFSANTTAGVSISGTNTNAVLKGTTNWTYNEPIGLSTDSKNSGLITQLSDITTSLDGYYYIVIATSTKTNIQVDIDEIATDLNGKADVDLSNVNIQGKQFIINQVIPQISPDYTAGITTSKSSSGITYTCPSDGIICVNLKGWNGSTCWVKINNVDVLRVTGNSATENSYTGTGSFPVAQGDIVTTSAPGQSAWTQSLIFYPYKGVL